jgi:hypothetical protein
MTRGTSRVMVTALAGVALSVLLIGTAFAASGGGYSPPNQNCQYGASDYATPQGQTSAGCHEAQLSVESGQTKQGDVAGGNTHYVDGGLNQLPLDPNTKTVGVEENVGEPGYAASPHAGCLGVNTDGTGSAPSTAPPTDPGSAGNATNGCGNNPNGLGFTTNWDYYQWYCPIVAAIGMPCEDKTPGTTTITPHTGTALDYNPIVQNGLLLYLGADDNLDAGEHDGLGPYSDAAGQHNNGAHNGSSDGGALTASLTPQNVLSLPSLTNPEGLLNASLGFCADGICIEGTSQQQTVYNGCGAPASNGNAPCAPGTPKNGNVYDYSKPDPSVQSEPPGCSSGDAKGSSDATCGPGGMNALRSGTPSNMNAEPGIQLYSDPDPQRSPAVPAPLWPTPGIYLGTCGLYLGSPALPTASGINSTPLGNGAGQIAIDPVPSQC